MSEEEHHSADQKGIRRDFALDLAARLGIESDPFALIKTFELNPDGSIDEETEAALEAIRQRVGYSLYEEKISTLDLIVSENNYFIIIA